MAAMQDALVKLDALMRRLVEADQTGRGMEPLRVADELGAIRMSLMQGRAVIPRQGGERHFRCDACGTITHGASAPATCPTCGKTKFYEADLESPVVDAGPG
jgi:rubrerythrin